MYQLIQVILHELCHFKKYHCLTLENKDNFVGNVFVSPYIDKTCNCEGACYSSINILKI